MNEVNVTSPSEHSERVKRLVMFLNTLPDIDEYRYEEEGKHHITNEWLCGTFAGRGFVGETPETAVSQLIDYFDRHIGHKSMVGTSVTESGWPNLDSVKNYLIEERREAVESFFGGALEGRCTCDRCISELEQERLDEERAREKTSRGEEAMTTLHIPPRQLEVNQKAVDIQDEDGKLIAVNVTREYAISFVEMFNDHGEI